MSMPTHLEKPCWVKILAVLCLIAGCGEQPPDFVVYQFDGFSIALPGQQPEQHTEQGSDGRISSVRTQAGGTKFLVVYWEIPVYLLNITDKVILKSLLSGASDWKKTSHKDVSVAGMPGKEIEAETVNGTYLLSRLLRINNRVYLLTIAGSKPIRRTLDTQRFFDSFKLRE
jgi:hypothetical protein